VREFRPEIEQLRGGAEGRAKFFLSKTMVERGKYSSRIAEATREGGGRKESHKPFRRWSIWKLVSKRKSK